MAVYRIDLRYDGSGFHGYARQQGLRTVQGVLEDALATVLGPVDTSVAGRTDAGVHAAGQVVSFRSDAKIDPVRLRRSLNTLLSPDVAVRAVTAVGQGFDARFSASSRTYRYYVADSIEPNPMRRHAAWHVPGPLDLAAMNAAVEPLLGSHDFASFCRQAAGRSTERVVLAAEWTRQAEEVVLEITATSFCHQMVRGIVAMCVAAGRGRLDPASVPAILFARDRDAARGAAPAHGLILWSVAYP